MWEEESSSSYAYYGGWGVYDGINDKFYSYWRGIPPERLTENHIPARQDLEEILRLMQSIKDRIDALTEDPDGPLGERQSKLDDLSDKANEAMGRAMTMQYELQSVQNFADTVEDKINQANSQMADLQQRAQALSARRDAINADVTDLEGRI
jgi:chromosome segregation ATPase